MQYSAAAAGPQLFDPLSFGDTEAAWAHGGPNNWRDNVYNIPIATRGCCPTCRVRMPQGPLDVAICDSMPPSLAIRPGPNAPIASASTARAAAALSTSKPQPETKLFVISGQLSIGIRVGTGDPAAGIGRNFEQTVVYFVAILHRQKKSFRLSVKFAIENDPGRLWLLDDAEWARVHTSQLIAFDPLFAGLSRTARVHRVWKYLSLANVPQDD